ncbi:MAG: class I SAM-dependent methyltransferase [Sandaracinaceae bacterium]
MDEHQASCRARLLAELPARMRSLYATGAYFVRVPAGSTEGFETAYWGEIVDPDGQRRDRFAERDLAVADLEAELSFIRARGPGRILDVGCGLGWLLSALDDRWEKHGLEVSRVAAEHASRYGAVVVGSAQTLPYEREAFDLVVCHHVIEHLEDPVSGLREIHRVLKTGGSLVLGTPDFDSAAARRWRERFRLTFDPTHVSLFSADSMHRFLRDHGFVIDAVDFPYFETRHFTKENLLRAMDADGVSPPFYGSFMTFYATKR